MPARIFLTSQEEQEIIEAIRQAEQNTSGEIRVHLEDTSSIPPYHRAKDIFVKLEMHHTADRNGVLLYFAVDDHAFAIFGDEGIHKEVPDDFWESTKDIITHHFKESQFKIGVITAIKNIGEVLKTYFPYQIESDINELPDEISKENV
ncbi:MAG: TPM domain-containing protein [Capnocytophaga sp.]|nr:TPM domain-containing protein [Capnocytophaga sp.]